MYNTVKQLFYGLLAAMLVAPGCVSEVQNEQHTENQYAQRLSVEKLKEWQDLRYGMFIHYGMSTFLEEDLPGGNAPVETYAPTDLDVAQWVRVAKDAGMQYAVLTAKHVSGHCLWPSEYTEYDVENNEDNTDVVGEFVKECREQGIQPGLYYCSYDNHHTFFSLMPGESKNTSKALITPTENDLDLVPPPPYTTSLYQNFMTAQIDELLERYSPLVEFWIDIPIILGNGYRKFLYDHITERYPDMVVVMNHGQKRSDKELVFLEDKAWPTDVLTLEKYTSNEPYDPVWTIQGEEIYFPAESCYPISGKWFWHDNDEVKPIEDLVEICENSLKNRINLLLNVPPDKTGQIPEKWIDPLMEIKDRMNNMER